jgi:hypothetical protein
VKSFMLSTSIAVFALLLMASTPRSAVADTFTFGATPVTFSSNPATKTVELFLPGSDLGDAFGFSLAEILNYEIPSLSFYDFSGAKLVAVDTFTGDFVTDVVGLGDKYAVTFNYSAASIPSVPEPSTLALLGTSVLGLAGVGRKKLLA